MPSEEAVTYAFKPKLKWSKVEVGLHVNLGLHIKASQLSYLCIISPFRVQRGAFSVTSVLQRTKIFQKSLDDFLKRLIASSQSQ